VQDEEHDADREAVGEHWIDSTRRRSRTGTTAIEWPLDSDPSIRWRLLRDLNRCTSRGRRRGTGARGARGLGRPAARPAATGWLCGSALGALNAVTRSFDGAVDLAEPYPTPWDAAFFASFEGVIDREIGAHGMSDLAYEVRRARGREHLLQPDRAGGHAASWEPVELSATLRVPSSPEQQALAHVSSLCCHEPDSANVS
jgi:hypothetical protein